MVFQHIFVAFAVALILAPFSHYTGQIVSRVFKAPQITGYLLSGIICGPYVLGILSSESLLELTVIERACLAIIGVAAGAELHVSELMRSRKQVFGLTAAICVLSWIFCYASLQWVAAYFPSLPFLVDRSHVFAVSTLGATLMMARSPASAIAVLKEMDGRGPFSSLVMAVVVVKDVVVITAYALNLEAVRIAELTQRGQLSAASPLISALLPVLSVALSSIIGLVGSLVLGLCIRPHPKWVSWFPTWSPVARHRMSLTVLLLLSTLVFQAAHAAEAEPLLACVVMGMVVSNKTAMWSERSEKDREELLAMLTQIMSVSNVAFFGLAGAALKLSALRDMFGPALVVCLARLVGIYTGSWLGGSVTHTGQEHRRVFWMSMVTQAGVAMGLARLAGTQFPDWGPHFQTFMISIVLLNLLIGPPMFKYSLVRVGEAAAVLGVLPMKGSAYKPERQTSTGGDDGSQTQYMLLNQEQRHS